MGKKEKVDKIVMKIDLVTFLGLVLVGKEPYNEIKIQKMSARLLESLGLNIKFEYTLKDKDSHYRFDVMGWKGKSCVLIECKSKIGVRDLGQMRAYLKNISKYRDVEEVILASNAHDYHRLLEGELGEMLKELMDDGLHLCLFVNEHFPLFFENYNELKNRYMTISEKA